MSKNKVALVTGGTGGLGGEICRQLFTSGCKVVANYYPADKEHSEKWQAEQKAAGFDIEIAPADVSNFEETGTMIADVESNSAANVHETSFSSLLFIAFSFAPMLPTQGRRRTQRMLFLVG